MPKQPKFITIQQEFSGHIKNPDQINRPEDVDDRHMAIYRDLFFNNVMGFLSGGFPVLAEVLGEKRWKEIGRDFFSRHNNQTPYFLEISREFLVYLESEFFAEDGDPEYLYELAHYEWLELYVDVEPEVLNSEFNSEYDKEGDLLTEIPVVSQIAEGFLYQYPVHQISIENASPEPKQTALIIYRKPDDSVGFIETNPFTLQLLILLKQQDSTGGESLSSLLEHAGLENNQAAYQGGIDTLKLWQESGLILGTKPLCRR